MQWTLAKDGAQQAILNFVREKKRDEKTTACQRLWQLLKV